MNLLSIKEHNIKHKKGLELYATGLNQFSDLNWTRINEVYLTNLSKYSLKPKKKEMILLKYALNKSTDIPSSWDWRTMGVVSGVKLQGECGACWAFSAAGALEGQLNNKTDHFIELSSQQLIDCSQSFGNHGCLGGDMNNAFRYVESNGIQKEENYPYLNKDTFKFSSRVVHLAKYRNHHLYRLTLDAYQVSGGFQMPQKPPGYESSGRYRCQV
ncbi:unnamed protein product [Trichobilharzia regenti]|nr:unnamed protein product [Trichobilharzia regenti]